MAAAAKIALGHEQDSSDGSPGRSAGSERSSSEVLRPSSSCADQFDIEVSTRSHGSSITHQPQNGHRLEVPISRGELKIPIGPNWDMLLTLLAGCFDLLEGGWPCGMQWT